MLIIKQLIFKTSEYANKTILPSVLMRSVRRPHC